MPSTLIASRACVSSEACPRSFATCRSAGHEGDHGHVRKASDHLSVRSTRNLSRSLHLTLCTRMVRRLGQPTARGRNEGDIACPTPFGRSQALDLRWPPNCEPSTFGPPKSCSKLQRRPKTARISPKG